MTTSPPLDHIGVGIDTARYGHRVSFLRPDRQQAAKPLTVLENHDGYQALQQRLEQLQQQHPQARFHVRSDAAGQYAVNLEHFLRGLPLPLTISIGEPKRNKDYQKAHFPKRTSDDTESQAMARFAVVEQPNATLAVPPQMSLLREITGRLQAQAKQTTQAVNRLHNLMARVFPELATLADDFAAQWVLRLLDRYPTAERIAHARRSSLAQLPYLPKDQAEPLQQAAQHSVGSLRGEVAETLVRELVTQVRHCLTHEDKLRHLLQTAFRDLPPSGHRQVQTIPGIGLATAAVLVATIIDIDRFDGPEHLVGYFGVFPQEDRSGVDKHGQPLPPGSQRRSHKGNDLVRSYLWNAARTASLHNPAIRALYRRLQAKGKRGDVALGHCMRQLLHLVFAVWQTDRPFDEKHFPWEPPSDTPPATSPAAAEPAASANQPSSTPAPTPTPAATGTPAGAAAPTVTTSTPVVASASGDAPVATALPAAATAAAGANDQAVGHTQALPAQPVVTTAADSVDAATVPVKPARRATAAMPTARPQVDFAFLREQITLAQVLQHLGLEDLRGRGQQRRGHCPVHDAAASGERTFSVHLGKNLYHCFHASCGSQGNVLDLWAAVQRLPLYEAALHLAETFHLQRHREEEPVKGTVGPTNGKTV